MTDASQDLSNELLRRIHLRFDKVDHAISEPVADNLDMGNQLHALHGDVNSFRGTPGHLEGKLDRIEVRLDLREFQSAINGRSIH